MVWKEKLNTQKIKYSKTYLLFKARLQLDKKSMLTLYYVKITTASTKMTSIKKIYNKK